MSDASYTPLNLGDTQDDDPQVIDSLVEQAPEPPAPPVTPIDTPEPTLPKVPTRLLTVGQTIDPLWPTPTLLLPADTSRKFLTLRVTSPAGTATDGVAVFSDVKGATTGLAVLYHGQSLPLDSHTGEVRVLGVGAASVHVDVWSVTE